MADRDETGARADVDVIRVRVSVRLRAVPPQFGEVVVRGVESGRPQQSVGGLGPVPGRERTTIDGELDVGLALVRHGDLQGYDAADESVRYSKHPTPVPRSLSTIANRVVYYRVHPLYAAGVKEEPETFGQRLRSIRESQRRSLTDVADRAGISKAYLSQLERDDKKQPGYDVVVRLATALGVSVEHLTGRPAVWDPTYDDRYPEALRAFAEQAQLPQGDIEMLAHVHYRGRQPTDVDDWAHIYETIRRTIR